MRSLNLPGLLGPTFLALSCAVSGDDKPPAAEAQADRVAFDRALAGEWREAFTDPGAGDWTEKWSLDGEVAAVTNTKHGMQLTAGPQFRNNAHHMVLWTKAVFEGDLMIEYDYTRLDFETRCVNIIYIQATGSGRAPYLTDIGEWRELRHVPAMSTYFDNMNTYHISYAAFSNVNDSGDDYVRARRYMPHKTGLKNTDLEPDYFRTGLFNPGVPHRFTIVKRGNHLHMRVRNDEKTSYFHWHNDKLPPVEAGRIGLRHMFCRAARYAGFRVSQPAKGNPDNQ